jgi:hypothetical protein
MKKALVVLAVVLAASLWGQEQKPKAGPGVPDVKVFTVRPANTDRIRRTLEMVVGKEHVAAEAGSNTFVVTANPALMPSVQQVVKDLDVSTQPAQNVELTFYVLQGSKEPEAGGASLPTELESTVKQLKSAFAYQSFRLLDTLFIRGRSGQFANVSGRAESRKGDPPSNYNLRVLPSVSSDARPPAIRLDALRFNFGGPWSVGFEADVDIKEGQKVVIGKSGIEGNQSALILVATGRIVD